MLGRPSDEEALRIVVAFYCIMEPEKRADLIKLAETFATQSAVVQGHTHFSLLDRDGQRPSVIHEASRINAKIAKPDAS